MKKFSFSSFLSSDLQRKPLILVISSFITIAVLAVSSANPNSKKTKMKKFP